MEDIVINQRRWRIIIASVAFIVVIAGAWQIKRIHWDYRFGVVEDNRLYKSGCIPPDKLKTCIEEHGIRTVIDLRNPGTNDDLCPEKRADIEAERQALDKIGVVHAHIPSNQVPKPETLEQFFRVMDNPDSYPVLLHCYHGTGRTELLAAVYRMEYLDWSVEKAVAATRLIVTGSSFAADKSKGKFLRNYRKRPSTKSTSTSKPGS